MNLGFNEPELRILLLNEYEKENADLSQRFLLVLSERLFSRCDSHLFRDDIECHCVGAFICRRKGKVATIVSNSK